MSLSSSNPCSFIFSICSSSLYMFSWLLFPASPRVTLPAYPQYISPILLSRMQYITANQAARRNAMIACDDVMPNPSTCRDKSGAILLLCFTIDLLERGRRHGPAGQGREERWGRKRSRRREGGGKESRRTQDRAVVALRETVRRAREY